MKLALAALIGATCLVAPAMAQERADLPPPEVVAEALDTHPSVEAAGADVSAARADARMLASGPHEVTLVGSYIRRTVKNEGGFDEFDGTLQRGLRLPGKARLDREAGLLGIEEAQNNHEDARHQASLVLMQGWHDLLLAGAKVRTDRAELANYDSLVRAVARREQLRDAARLDVDQARSERALAQARLAQSEAALAEARARLGALFPGLPLPAEVPEPVSPELPQAGVDTLHDLVLSRSHEIRAAESKAARYGVLGERAMKDRMADPTLGFRLFSERGGNERGAGVVFSLPFGGGYRSAAADKASAAASRAQLELAMVRRDITATADADASNARTLFAAWQASRDALASATSAAQLSRKGYDAGVTDLADLLAVERQAIAARRAEVDARVSALRAIMKLRVDSHDLWAPLHDED
ncbi:MAG: TolC family protein [Sphingomonadales bacterium]|nr:TolC family protein [Sphingomonadales bacterium]MDE2569116.1 TolC family protein [Sphingomonadales bacterium]